MVIQMQLRLFDIFQVESALSVHSEMYCNLIMPLATQACSQKLLLHLLWGLNDLIESSLHLAIQRNSQGALFLETKENTKMRCNFPHAPGPHCSLHCQSGTVGFKISLCLIPGIFGFIRPSPIGISRCKPNAGWDETVRKLVQ